MTVFLVGNRYMQSALSLGTRRWCWLIWLVLLTTAFASSDTFASDGSTGLSDRIWLNPGIYSLHFDRDKHLRDNNIGIGVEIGPFEDQAILAGTYINSNGARSHYGAYAWRPVQWKLNSLNASAGMAVGAFDGYTNYHNGGWFIAPLPILSIEGNRIGVNFTVVPTVKNRLDGAIGFQLKVRI